MLNTCSAEDTTGLSQIPLDNDIPISPVCITRQDAFAEALNHGLGVSEHEPNGKANEQIQALFDVHVKPNF